MQKRKKGSKTFLVYVIHGRTFKISLIWKHLDSSVHVELHEVKNPMIRVVKRETELQKLLDKVMDISERYGTLLQN